jgi:hypothetical protein
MGSGRGTTRRTAAAMANKEAEHELMPVGETPLSVFTPVELYNGGSGVIISSHLQRDGSINYGIRCDMENTYSQMKANEDFNHLPGFVWGDEEETHRERDVLGKVVYLEHGDSGMIFPGQVVSIAPTQEAMQGSALIDQDDLRVMLYFYETLQGAVRGPFGLGELMRTQNGFKRVTVERVAF